MIRETVIAFSLLSATPAFPAEVLTGEHDGFTRVTVPVEGSVAWSLNRDEAGYELQLGAPTVLDLTNFFERISRQRITDVSFSGETLSLKLGCLCIATAFEYLGRFVVIDVANAPTSSPPRAGSDPFQKSEVSTAPTPLPVIIGAPAISLDRSAIEETRLNTQTVPLFQIEQALIKNLTDASSTGILSVADRNVARIDLPLSDGFPDPPLATQSSPGMKVRSGSTPNGPDSQPRECWPEEFTDVTEWESKRTSFDKSIPAMRRAITDSNDRLNAAAVEDLAKVYIFYGFGQEALRTLDLDGVQSRSRRAVRIIANILEGMNPINAELRMQTRCPGLAPFWAFVAVVNPSDWESWDVNFIVQSFKGLPRPLQVTLGARVAERLRMINALGAATLVLDTTQRNLDLDIEVKLLNAEILLERNDISSAKKIYENILETETDLTLNEILRLIDFSLALNLKTPQLVTERLEGLLSSYQGDLKISQIVEKLAIAQAHNGDLNSAIDTLRSNSIEGDIYYSIAWSEVGEIIAQNASDRDFFDFAFSKDSYRPHAGVTNQIAARLLEEGLPERANELLNIAAVGAVMAERRYLRAMAAMQMDDPTAARAALAGISTPRAEAILAKKPWPATEANAALRQRTSNSNDLSQSEGSILQSAAVGEERPLLQFNPNTPLQSGRAIIADSLSFKEGLGSDTTRLLLKDTEIQ